MLLGSYETRLDLKKGRTALPAKFRQLLGKKIVVTMGNEGALLIVSHAAWKSVVEDIVNRPFISQPAREIDRFLLGNAYEADLDDQGRFIVPSALRGYGQLKEEVVFVGMGNRVELWSKNGWQAQLKYLKQNINQISQKLAEAKAGE